MARQALTLRRLTAAARAGGKDGDKKAPRQALALRRRPKRVQLQNMPAEVLFLVAQRLERPVDVVRFAGVCKTYREIAKKAVQVERLVPKLPDGQYCANQIVECAFRSMTEGVPCAEYDFAAYYNAIIRSLVALNNLGKQVSLRGRFGIRNLFAKRMGELFSTYRKRCPHLLTCMLSFMQLRGMTWLVREFVNALPLMGKLPGLDDVVRLALPHSWTAHLVRHSGTPEFQELAARAPRPDRVKAYALVGYGHEFLDPDLTAAEAGKMLPTAARHRHVSLFRSLVQTHGDTVPFGRLVKSFAWGFCNADRFVVEEIFKEYSPGPYQNKHLGETLRAWSEEAIPHLVEQHPTFVKWFTDRFTKWYLPSDMVPAQQ